MDNQSGILSVNNQSGIYEIVNTVNGKRYIGSARCFKKRWWKHRWELRTQQHNNQKLQRAWNKYGEAAFKFLPVLTCQPSMLLFYEQQVLDKVKPEYNVALDALAPMVGRKFTEEHRAKIGAAHKGKIVTSETRMKLSVAGKKRVLSVEARLKVSRFQKGRVHSAEHLANQHAAIIAYWATRPKQTQEEKREKKRIAQLNRRAAKRGRRSEH